MLRSFSKTTIFSSFHSLHIRHFGIFDRVKEKITSTTEKLTSKVRAKTENIGANSEVAAYQKQRDLLLSYKTFDFPAYAHFLNELVSSGWRAKLASFSKTAEFEEMKDFVAIIDAMQV